MCWWPTTAMGRSRSFWATPTVRNWAQLFAHPEVSHPTALALGELGDGLAVYVAEEGQESAFLLTSFGVLVPSAAGASSVRRWTTSWWLAVRLHQSRRHRPARTGRWHSARCQPVGTGEPRREVPGGTAEADIVGDSGDGEGGTRPTAIDASKGDSSRDRGYHCLAGGGGEDEQGEAEAEAADPVTNLMLGWTSAAQTGRSGRCEPPGRRDGGGDRSPASRHQQRPAPMQEAKPMTEVATRRGTRRAAQLRRSSSCRPTNLRPQPPPTRRRHAATRRAPPELGRGGSGAQEWATALWAAPLLAAAWAAICRRCRSVRRGRSRRPGKWIPSIFFSL
jgi:hypothetical protein